MRITSFNNEPISEIPFLNAGRGQGSFYVDRLPVHVGHLSCRPDDLEAIIATADLQGRERFQDGIGGSPRLPACNAHYLDGEFTVMDGVNVAGVGGIVGNPGKPHRKTDDDFAAHIEALVTDAMDVLVMHDGPDDPERGQRGSPIIRQALERLGSTLLIRGHAHWHEPFAELANGTQVLNVDCRVAVLRR